VIWLVVLDRTLVSSVTSQLLVSVSNEIALKALIFGKTSITIAVGAGNWILSNIALKSKANNGNEFVPNIFFIS
jgi:hypothetical protein